MRSVVRFVSLGAAVSWAASASADLPPDPGQKRVAFGFVVKGIKPGTDRVLVAYPCGRSEGAPFAEHRKLEDGVEVSVGRRGGPCTIYSIEKSRYEAWVKDYKPQPPASSDPAVEALVAKGVRCSGAPSLSTELPASDPRSSITQTLNVTTLDAATCVLTPVTVPRSAATMPTASGPARAPARSSGCTIGAAPAGESLGLLFAAGSLTILLRRRRSAPQHATRTRSSG